MQPPRTVAWEGARNLFDLGGLPTKDGGRTTYGRVWRSAAPEWMTTAGWQAARESGLVRVIDLRNEMEVGREPVHPVVDDDAAAGIEFVRTPTEDPDDPEFLAECGPWLDHPRSWTPNMERYPDKLARVFSAIADAPGPVLVHCAGGRDRTGLVVSMLLALAGVEDEAIVGCYEQGFRGAASHRGHGLGYDPTTGTWVAAEEADWNPAELDRAIADRMPTVRQWLQDTDVVGYLTDAGIDSSTMDRLQRSLG